jgi:hypothetical protein
MPYKTVASEGPWQPQPVIYNVEKMITKGGKEQEGKYTTAASLLKVS